MLYKTKPMSDNIAVVWFYKRQMFMISCCLLYIIFNLLVSLATLRTRNKTLRTGNEAKLF